MEQLIQYIQNLKFTQEDLDYYAQRTSLRGFSISENFRFSCDVRCPKDAIFPNEPVVIVRGPIIEAQFVETMIL